MLKVVFLAIVSSFAVYLTQAHDCFRNGTSAGQKRFLLSDDFEKKFRGNMQRLCNSESSLKKTNLTKTQCVQNIEPITSLATVCTYYIYYIYMYLF